MNSAPGTWVVIPAFNEATVISRTLKDVRAYFCDIAVVDDCSSDQTAQVALDAGAHVCRHPVNLGQGAALYTGICYALLQKADMIVTFDADGQHSARDAATMVEIMRRENCDVVLGSRFLGKAEGLSQARGMLLKIATVFTKATTSLAITDSHNGLRVLNGRAAERIRIRQNRMAHASEILDQVAKLGLRYVEAPCTVSYTEYSRKKGQRMAGAFTILSDILMLKMYR